MAHYCEVIFLPQDKIQELLLYSYILHGQVAGVCEYGNELSGSINAGNLISCKTS